MTLIIPVDPDRPRPEETLRAKVMLDKCLLAILPTDTVYGIVTPMDCEGGVRRIYEVKGRSPDKPLPVLASISQAMTLFSDVPPAAEALIRAFWPGPLTIVLPASPSVPEYLTRDGKVGVRVPGCKLVLDICMALGRPLASTSANPSGEEPTTLGYRVIKQFYGTVDLIMDGGVYGTGKASTVVDLTDGVKMIREGAVSQKDIARVTGEKPLPP